MGVVQAKGKSAVISYQLSVISYQLSVISYQLKTKSTLML